MFSVQLLHKFSIHAADGPQKLLKVIILIFSPEWELHKAAQSVFFMEMVSFGSPLI